MWRWLVLTAAIESVGASDVLINFDELGAGTPISAHYASTLGVSFLGLGDGGPFEVIADSMCNGTLSFPHALSLNALAACPETNDQSGFFEIEFGVEQAFVAIRTLHAVAGTVSYLKAYSGPDDTSFIDQTFGDFNLVGVPQTLRIDRGMLESQIRRVRVGVFNLDNRRATFDDLSFEKAPVAVGRTGFGAVKARW